MITFQLQMQKGKFELETKDILRSLGIFLLFFPSRWDSVLVWLEMEESWWSALTGLILYSQWEFNNTDLLLKCNTTYLSYLTHAFHICIILAIKEEEKRWILTKAVKILNVFDTSIGIQLQINNKHIKIKCNNQWFHRFNHFN